MPAVAAAASVGVMSQATPDVEVDSLRLRYGEVTALDDLTFTLAGGKVHGPGRRSCRRSGWTPPRGRSR